MGGAIGDAELRAVRHLRVTVVGGAPATLVLARMAIVGSTWIKRSGTGVLEGVGGDVAAVSGRVEVGPVSKLTVGDAYASPPGVIEELDDPAAAIGGQGVEFSERSLGIAFEGVAHGHRAEVYTRFPQQPRDFMSYREARLWVVAPGGGFVPEMPAYFFVKIGTDDQNFYLYRKRLAGTATPGVATAEDWSPEVVINFEEWLRLRREAELRLISEPRLPDDPPLVIWTADSAYAIHMQDRGRAPNLAVVREMSLGVANATGAPIAGEVWVDELRLARGIRDAGLASALDAELRGGEFLYARASIHGRSGYFRQLRATPTFQDSRGADARATLHLGRLAPESWGLQLPLTVSWEREDRSPIFLGRSDVRVDRLQGVRRPGYEQTRADLALWRRGLPGDGPWMSFLAGLDARVGMGRSALRTITTESEGRTLDGSVAYELLPARRDVALFPGGVGDLLRRILPSPLDERVAGARLRWSPASVSVRGDFADGELSTWRYEQIIETEADDAVAANQAPRRDATLAVRVVANPLPSLTAEGEMLSGRDLLRVEELAEDPESRRLLDSERRRVAGVDLGWEADRRVRTRVVFEPSLADWTTTRFEMATIHQAQRNSDLIEFRDTALALLRNVDGQRGIVATVELDPSRAVAEEGERGWIGVWAGALDVLSLRYESGLTSRFKREAVDPGFGYELGWVGRNGFLVIDGDSASTLSDRELVRVGGGLRLPGAASVSVGYEHSRDQTLDTRSDRQDRREAWPDVTVSIADATPPAALRRSALPDGQGRVSQAVALVDLRRGGAPEPLPGGARLAAAAGPRAPPGRLDHLPRPLRRERDRRPHGEHQQRARLALALGVGLHAISRPGLPAPPGSDEAGSHPLAPRRAAVPNSERGGRVRPLRRPAGPRGLALRLVAGARLRAGPAPSLLRPAFLRWAAGRGDAPPARRLRRVRAYPRPHRPGNVGEPLRAHSAMW